MKTQKKGRKLEIQKAQDLSVYMPSYRDNTLQVGQKKSIEELCIKWWN